MWDPDLEKGRDFLLQSKWKGNKVRSWSWDKFPVHPETNAGLVRIGQGHSKKFFQLSKWMGLAGRGIEKLPIIEDVLGR